MKLVESLLKLAPHKQRQNIHSRPIGASLFCSFLSSSAFLRCTQSLQVSKPSSGFSTVGRSSSGGASACGSASAWEGRQNRYITGYDIKIKYSGIQYRILHSKQIIKLFDNKLSFTVFVLLTRNQLDLSADNKCLMSKEKTHIWK